MEETNANNIVIINPTIFVYGLEDNSMTVNDNNAKSVRFALKDNEDTFYISLFDVKKTLNKIVDFDIVDTVLKLKLLLKAGATFSILIEDHIAGEILQDGYVVKNDCKFSVLQGITLSNDAKALYNKLIEHVLFG